MTNWKAGLIHLGISAPIVAVAAIAMTLVWFPPPLFQAAGGGHLIVILASVDLVIGPVLTTLVYKEGKRTLKLDLSVIALIQICALLYGTYTIFLARPAYVVFVVNQFEVVTAADIPPEEQSKAQALEFKHSPLGRYRVVAARIPTGAEEQQRILFASLVGHDLSHFPQHYVPYASDKTAAVRNAHPISQLKALNARHVREIENWVADNGKLESEVRYVPVKAIKGDFAALIDAKTGQLLDFASFKPWQ